jgi:hypothetical protein
MVARYREADMVVVFAGEFYAYKRDGVSLIGIYPSRQLATAAVIAWEG